MYEFSGTTHYPRHRMGMAFGCLYLQLLDSAGGRRERITLVMWPS